MHSKLVLFLFVIPFSINPFSSFSQEVHFQNSDSKFELEIGYMLPFYNIDQQQFHFATNAPYTVNEETNSSKTFSLGLLYTKNLSNSLGLVLGIMNYYGEYQITIEYDPKATNRGINRKFVHDIKSFAPLSPVVGIQLSTKKSMAKNYFSFSLGLGLKPIVNIDDKRTHIVEQNNFEREEDSIVEDSALIYPFVKANYAFTNISLGLSYNHKLYNFIYKQDNTHIREGDIFNAEISHLSILLSFKL